MPVCVAYSPTIQWTEPSICRVLLDDCSMYHLDRVQEITTGCGARLCFLPPYSPDLIPLEEVFIEVKYILNANASLHRVTTDPELLIKTCI